MISVDEFNAVLRSFDLHATCKQADKVRNISLYDVILSPGERIKQIQKYSDEISLCLKAKSKPRIFPIPDKGIVRFEVVDELQHEVSLDDGLANFDAEGILPVFIGMATDGSQVSFDLAKNPHTLIAGCTGSGKTTLLHALVINSMHRDIDLFIIDAKGIEFNDYIGKYKQLHLVDNYGDAIYMLQFLHKEMEYRYDMMKTNKMSYADVIQKPLLVMIDELADLIVQDDDKSFRALLCKLTQKCRAAGIYCVVATQRPSADILSGVIKANFPARIACQVASGVDSKVILDTGGAEVLAGKGDAIIKNYKYNYQRFQVAR